MIEVYGRQNNYDRTFAPYDTSSSLRIGNIHNLAFFAHPAGQKSHAFEAALEERTDVVIFSQR